MEAPKLQSLYEDALKLKPNSADTPWSIVLGFDEFAPGFEKLANPFVGEIVESKKMQNKSIWDQTAICPDNQKILKW